MVKAIVTGVAGFIGSHIATELIRRNVVVIGIDNLSAGYIENIPEDVIFINADVYDIDKYSYLLKGVDVVFHNAASKKNICLKDPARDMEVNGIATYKLLNACVENSVNKFIHASTGSVYGEVEGLITEITGRNPVSIYGISKMAGENYVQYFNKYRGLDTTILRYFHVYGERQESNQDTGGVVAIFDRKFREKEDIIIPGDGSQQRVFTNVRDIVSANMNSWHKALSSGKIYNCASSEKTTINQLFDYMCVKHSTALKRIFTDPLPGDIYKFDVDNSLINEIGVTFKPISEII
jgi:UDP-glucose 4-epimerase